MTMTAQRKPGRPRSTRSINDARKDRHKPRKQVSVPAELVDRIYRLAEANDRAIAREVKRALQSYADAEEARLGIKPPESQSS